jgi:hypothetical protein
MSQNVSALTHRDPDGHLMCIDPLRDRPVWMAGATSETGAPSAMPVEPICALCKGARWIKEAVPFGHPHFSILFPCVCLQAEWARRAAVELARLSNLAAMRDKTFATFNPFVPGLREVVPRVRTYARKPDGWLTLLGPYGTGKTHLAAAIANEALNREEPVLFAAVPDLLDHLRATFGPQSAVAYDERFETDPQASLTRVALPDDAATGGSACGHGFTNCLPRSRNACVSDRRRSASCWSWACSIHSNQKRRWRSPIGWSTRT